ncbi:MAG: apolipoprotein N-acyltransferase [Pyrinomonadaceae bacterium]
MLLALVSAGLLILAFPPFEFWFTAWFALIPLLWAIERETERGRPRSHEPEGRTGVFRTLFSSSGQAFPRSFILGWIFGNVFFFGTCWWLTYAPIHYASFPAPLAYFLLVCVTSTAAVFPGIFAAITAFLLRRFGSIAFLAVPFVWVFTEFARYWLTGNNWNAIAYSQSFTFGELSPSFLVGALTKLMVIAGGQLFAGFAIVILNTAIAFPLLTRTRRSYIISCCLISAFFLSIALHAILNPPVLDDRIQGNSQILALQPNVPMSGLTLEKWRELRKRHVQLAESAIETINERRTTNNEQSNTVIFPESPMNFMYGDDPETQEFINGFARKNYVSVLFNSAEPNHADGKYFNSAVLVGPDGKKSAQYDKIYLLPFGEAVPFPFDFIVPAFVGSFSYGNEYDLLPLGDVKAGVMICFESHFGQLSREYVRNGADVIIEMTNDGYLGPTPVLRQHLANAVFRAVETNRPVLRVTNVGITAYINERGEVLDAAESYVEATRVWSVAKSDGSQTFYVKYGDWLAWLCSIVTLILLIGAGWKQKNA